MMTYYVRKTVWPDGRIRLCKMYNSKYKDRLWVGDKLELVKTHCPATWVDEKVREFHRERNPDAEKSDG